MTKSAFQLLCSGTLLRTEQSMLLVVATYLCFYFSVCVVIRCDVLAPLYTASWYRSLLIRPPSRTRLGVLCSLLVTFHLLLWSGLPVGDLPVHQPQARPPRAGDLLVHSSRGEPPEARATRGESPETRAPRGEPPEARAPRGEPPEARAHIRDYETATGASSATATLWRLTCFLQVLRSSCRPSFSGSNSLVLSHLEFEGGC